MKIIQVCVIFIIYCSLTSAQNHNSSQDATTGLYLGITGGYNHSMEYHFYEDDAGIMPGLLTDILAEKIKGGTISRYHVGILFEADALFPDFTFGFLSGVILDGRGFRDDTPYAINTPGDYLEYKTMFIKVPLNVNMVSDFKKNNKLGWVIELGLPLSFALSGTLEGYIAPDKINEELTFGKNKEEDTYRRVHLQLYAGIGLAYNRTFRIMGSFSYGLSNMLPEPDEGERFQSYVFGLSAAYLFSVKKF